MILSSTQRELFVRDGFVIVRRLLPRDLVTATRERILAEVNAAPPAGETLYQARFTSLTAACMTPDVFAVGEALAGPHLRRDSIYSPFLESQGESAYLFGYVPVLRYPQPGPKLFQKPETGWHIDGYRGVTLFPALLYLVVFAYLSDVRDYGGATVVRPGSHRQIFESWRRSGDVSDNRLPDLPWSEAVPVEGEAGDVLFLHYLLAHTGSPNHDGHIRVGLNSAIEPDPAHPYQPKSGAPTPEWTPMDYTLRTDTLSPPS
jgi:hypothetical protein